MKICIAAQAGGHLSQLLQIENVWKDKLHFFVTTEQVIARELKKRAPVYLVRHANRKYPFLLVLLFFQCARIVYLEKPDMVISSGAAAGCIMCFLAKLIGSKVIWIDSIAMIEKLSLSGKIVKHFADLFLVQWPDLVKQYKHVKYVGAIM